MRIFFILSSAAVVCGCMRAQLRYVPSAPGSAARAGAAILSRVDFVDRAEGLRQERVNVALARPLIDSFHDATMAELAARGFSIGASSGAAVRVEMNNAEMIRSPGFYAGLEVRIAYTVVVTTAGGAECTYKYYGGAEGREGFFSSPVEEVLNSALARSVDKLASWVESSSCLSVAEPTPSSPASSPTTVAATENSNVVVLALGGGAGRGGSNLRGAEDAQEFFARARERLSPVDDHVALVKGATLAEMNKRFEHWIGDRVVSGGKVVVYFSGWGARGRDGERYLVPEDGDPAYLDATCYPLSHLLHALGRLPVSAQVVLDASFAGAGGRTLTIPGAAPRPDQEWDGVPKNVVVLTAASAAFSAQSYDGRGRLTQALLNAWGPDQDLAGAFDAAASGLPGQAPRRRAAR